MTRRERCMGYTHRQPNADPHLYAERNSSTQASPVHAPGTAGALVGASTRSGSGNGLPSQRLCLRTNGPTVPPMPIMDITTMNRAHASMACPTSLACSSSKDDGNYHSGRTLSPTQDSTCTATTRHTQNQHLVSDYFSHLLGTTTFAADDSANATPPRSPENHIMNLTA